MVSITYTPVLVCFRTLFVQVIMWVTEHAVDHLEASAQESATNTRSPAKKNVPEREPDTFSRFWIFSHHIYSKTKRKMILEWSKELKLSGFSMPGKPGVIFAEGYMEHCEEYWKRFVGDRFLTSLSISFVLLKTVLIYKLIYK